MGASLSLGAIRAVASKSRPRRKAQAALRVWSAGVTQLSACGPALALVELSSIAAGMQAADAMAKRASLDVLKAGTVHNGKYLVLVGGQVADVEAAVRRGRSRGRSSSFATWSSRSSTPACGRTWARAPGSAAR